MLLRMLSSVRHWALFSHVHLGFILSKLKFCSFFCTLKLLANVTKSLSYGQIGLSTVSSISQLVVRSMRRVFCLFSLNSSFKSSYNYERARLRAERNRVFLHLTSLSLKEVQITLISRAVLLKKSFRHFSYRFELREISRYSSRFLRSSLYPTPNQWAHADLFWLLFHSWMQQFPLISR